MLSLHKSPLSRASGKDKKTDSASPSPELSAYSFIIYVEAILPWSWAFPSCPIIWSGILCCPAQSTPFTPPPNRMEKSAPSSNGLILP